MSSIGLLDIPPSPGPANHEFSKATLVAVGVGVLEGVMLGVGVLEGVMLGVGVLEGVLVGVGELLMVTVGVLEGV